MITESGKRNKEAVCKLKRLEETLIGSCADQALISCWIIGHLKKVNAFALNRCPTYTFVILKSSSSIDRVPLLSVVEHLLVKGMIRALSPFACALLIDFISVRPGQRMEERLLKGLSRKLCKLPVFDKTQSRSGGCSQQMFPSNFGRRKKT